MTFAVATARKPASINKGSTSRFQRDFHSDALRNHRGTPMRTGRLYVRIVWFHDGPAGDLDNIIKPILDALIAIAYPDDHLVAKCACEKVDLSGHFTLSTRDILPDAYSDLITLISGTPQHIIYVEVRPLPSGAVVFGPVQ